MGLLQRLKHDLMAGLATLRHGTAQAAIRALEETELLRIRLDIRKLDQQLDELYRDVGERGFIFAREVKPLRGFSSTLKLVDWSKKSRRSKVFATSLNRRSRRFEPAYEGLVTHDAARRCGYRHAHLPIADSRSAA